MTWENFTFSIFTFCIGLINLLIGSYQLKHPYPAINAIYGYKTKRSMLSQQQWDFAQRYSAKELIRWSCILIAVSIAGLLLYNINLMTGVFLAMTLYLCLIAMLFIRTEKALRKQFGNRTL